METNSELMKSDIHRAVRPSRIPYVPVVKALILTHLLRPLRRCVRMHAAAQAHVLEFCTFAVRIIQTSRDTLLLACSPVLLGCTIVEFTKITVKYV